MKPPNFERVIFTLNLIAIAIVAVLVAPTTQIFAWWYPERENILWLVPAIVLGTCCILWLIMRMSIPLLIRWGVYEDQRKQIRTKEDPKPLRLIKMIVPMVTLTIEMLLLMFMIMCVMAFLRSETIEDVLTKLTFKQEYRITQEDVSNRYR